MSQYPLANVHPDAKIGDNVTIEPFATVKGDVVIGDGSWIAGHASQFWTHGLSVADRDIHIGKKNYIGSAVRFAPGAAIGDENIVAFLRKCPSTGRRLICVTNFSPVSRATYRLGLPGPGCYREILNTDAACFAGGNRGNGGAIHAEPRPWHGRQWSAQVVLPPLATLWFEVPLA